MSIDLTIGGETLPAAIRCPFAVCRIRPYIIYGSCTKSSHVTRITPRSASVCRMAIRYRWIFARAPTYSSRRYFSTSGFLHIVSAKTILITSNTFFFITLCFIVDIFLFPLLYQLSLLILSYYLYLYQDILDKDRTNIVNINQHFQ